MDDKARELIKEFNSNNGKDRIRIIRQGRSVNSLKPDQIARFKCLRCGCIWESTTEHCTLETPIGYRYFQNCPNCGDRCMGVGIM